MYHSIKTIEKEYNSIFKLIESLNILIDNVETFSINVSNELDELTELYEQKQKSTQELNRIEHLLEDDQLSNYIYAHEYIIFFKLYYIFIVLLYI